MTWRWYGAEWALQSRRRWGIDGTLRGRRALAKIAGAEQGNLLRAGDADVVGGDEGRRGEGCDGRGRFYQQSIDIECAYECEEEREKILDRQNFGAIKV